MRTVVTITQGARLLLLMSVMGVAISARSQLPFNIISLKQVTYLQPFTRYSSSDVEVAFSYVNPISTGTPKFLNIYVRRPLSTIQGWMAQNLLLDTFANTRVLTYTMKLSSLGYIDDVPITALEMAYYVTDTVQKTAITVAPSAYLPYTCGTSIWFWGSGLRLDSTRTVLGTAPPNNFLRNDSLRSVTRGCSMPNIDLDSGAHNPTNTPGYAGDWNACVPASCANSMQWLEGRHPTKINSGLSDRKKLEELSKLMRRMNNQGVYTDTMIRGKLAYIDKYKLPIRVKFQDIYIKDSCLASFDSTYKHCAENKSNRLAVDTIPKLDFNWLFEEMKRGEDVEMLVQWVRDSAGTKTSSAHAVVISDVAEIKGVRRITIKDDSTQGAAGGTRERPLTFDTTLNKRYPTIPEWGWANGTDVATCFITGFVSESYDSTVTFPAQGIPTPTPPVYRLAVNGNPVKDGQAATVTFELPQAAYTRLYVIDITGRHVATLGEGLYSAGKHQLRLDASSLPSGIYFLIMKTDQHLESIKLLKE
jgi:hypothetical protein